MDRCYSVKINIHSFNEVRGFAEHLMGVSLSTTALKLTHQRSRCLRALSHQKSSLKSEQHYASIHQKKFFSTHAIATITKQSALDNAHRSRICAGCHCNDFISDRTMRSAAKPELIINHFHDYKYYILSKTE